MTICNMSIEAGARAGMVAPDDTTFAYVEGRPARAPGRRLGARARRLAHAADRRRRDLRHGGHDRRRRARVRTSAGARTRAQSRHDRRRRARPRRLRRPGKRGGRRARARVHGRSRPARRSATIRPDTIFIGSCTNSRMEDLRVAASVVGGREGRRRHARARRARLVRGEAAGRSRGPRPRCSTTPGFEWRGAGCSMCLGMNPDILNPGDRSASTSNRNFEGPAGQGRADAPGEPRGRGRHRDRRPLHDPGGPRPDGARHRHRGHRAARRPQPTSTPTRSSRPSTSSGSSAPGSGRSCSPSGARIPTS